jgi:hypothetical protein
MDSKEFKKVFGEIAKTNGFESAFGGWFKESPECIAVLELQKSNFGNYYQLNIKIYVQGMFSRTYNKNKDLVKKDVGHIRNGEPPEYKSVFDFDEPMDDGKRREKLEKLFSEFITPFTNKALSKFGIKELADKGIITLLPAVQKELGL